MNELMIQILPLISQVVNHATKDRDESHELCQELVLKCYENESKIQELYNENKLLGWLYVVCRNHKYQEHKQKQKHNQLKQNYTHATESNHIAPNIKKYDELMLTLDPVDAIWVSVYIYHDFNVSAINKATGLCRAKITTKINEIFERWKQSDIYLQD